MRQLVVGVGLAVVVAISGTAVAQAASTSVVGTGSYAKLTVNNGNANLGFKIKAPGGACDIKYLTVEFRDRDGTRYEIDGGCYSGPVWIASLVRRGTLVECAGFTLTFDADKAVWSATIPRTCLAQLGGAVKVTTSYVDDYSAFINEVPATRYVSQG